MSASENGWQPAWVDASGLNWITVPGTNVSLQLMKGQPTALLRAFAADFNAFIEPLRDADSAAYTPTNSVSTSNHLNGTAMDLNWNSHPFRVLNAGFNDAQIATARELLTYYEDTVWWGNDWDTPKDAMHWNCSYNTYGNPHTADFIARKIRADGFSTFRRGNAPIPPPILSRADGYALKIITEGQRRGITPRGIQIALATGLVESNLQVYANARVPASMAIPHDAVGSDAYSVGIFQQQVRDTGGGWWWGDAATCMDPTSSAGLFYARLATKDYNGPNSPGSYAQAVQSSAFPDRYDERFADAVAIYNRLATTPPPPQGEDDLSAEAERMIAELHADWCGLLTSQSPLRHPAETTQYKPIQMLKAIDGSVFTLFLDFVSSLNDPGSIAELKDVAAMTDPDRVWDAQLAQAMLARLLNKPSASIAATGGPAPVAPHQVVYVDRPVAAAPSGSEGQIIGAAYDALSALPSLSATGKGVLTALTGLLQIEAQGVTA